MEELNDFMQLRKVVSEAVTQYKEARVKSGFLDLGEYADNCQTIEKLANPFLTGYFTIAIAGKMSAGKSTFINSLIGEQLLPTGHFQTTSCITWIVSSKERLMEVTFADGQTQTYKHNFATELSKLVAVPSEFENLPISDINNLIRGNNALDIILQKKDAIDVKTNTTSDASLWEKYVKATPKSKIVDKVVVHLQLPKEYEGWRIIDTPGVGAVGGIQEETLRLLTTKSDDSRTHSMVDAVILLHKGTENIQDESANKFAKSVSESIGHLAQGRLFFVLTHASSTEFLAHKDHILSLAKELFGKRLSIPEENITYVDSLVHRFVLDAKKSGKDFSHPEALFQPLHNWSKTEWSIIQSVVLVKMASLSNEGIEVSNETLFNELEKYSHFSVLRDKLNEFLNTEKERVFNELMELIETDLQANKTRLEQEIEAVCNGPEGINKRIKKVDKEYTEIQTALLKLQQKTTKGSIKKIFEFVEEDLENLSSKATIQEVRAAYLEITNKGLKAEEKYFKELISDFKKYANNFSQNNTSFITLDLNAIEQQAHENATTQVTDYSRAEKKVVKEGGFSASDQYAIYYPHTKDQTDFDQKLRGFVVMVKQEGRKYQKAFREGTIKKAAEFFKICKESIEKRKTRYEARLQKLKNTQNVKIEELESQLSEVLKALDIINQYQ